MGVEVNIWGVLAATIASMIVGSIWYSKPVFGAKWIKLTKTNMEGGMKPMLYAVGASLVTAYVLAHVSFLANQFFGNSFLKDSIQTAFWVWLGLTGARFVTHDAFEGRPMELTAINISYELATFLAMGAAIGFVGI